jgi:ribosomal protein S18 acetylase RimI-like enzyme
MYAVWVRKVSQSAEGVVYVGVLDDQIVGFIACSEDGRTGRIELVGVRRDLEGSGIATAILRRAIRWFAEQGCRTAQVVTQGRNVAAQCLYQRSGFFTQSVCLVYHRWFDETKGIL